MAYPFYHMQSEGFWRLVSKPGQEQELSERITSSMTRLQSVVLGAEIDQELFELISGQKGREELRAALLNTYFAPDVRQSLLREAVENQEAFEYSQRLLQAAEAAMPFGQPDKPQQIRDQGFRKAIMNLYSHRCALCGIRMITPEGHTIVEAAHIRPWADSQDDRPANGLALCRLCHWSFDHESMGVNEIRDPSLSLFCKLTSGIGHIMTLELRPIFPPDDHRHIPDQECLGWHRREVFRR
jgi:putative restriction endonuclease